MKRIRRRYGWVGRCETCKQPSERGERDEEANNAPEQPRSVSRSSFLLRRTARVLAVSAVSARVHPARTSQLDPAALAPAEMVHARALDDRRHA
jgi:hypothetical protein